MPTNRLSAINIVRRYHPNVTQVVDAKKGIDISVTDADCKDSKSKSPDSCAMARAFCRTFDGAIISLSTAYLIKGTKATRYHVPQVVSREIVSFDRHHDFSPGEYSLKAPPISQRLGPRRWKQSVKKRGYDNHKKRAHKTTGIRSL